MIVRCHTYFPPFDERRFVGRPVKLGNEVIGTVVSALRAGDDVELTLDMWRQMPELFDGNFSIYD